MVRCNPHEGTRNLRVDLTQVERKSEFGWKDLFEPERMEKDTNGNCSSIQKIKPVGELQIVRGDESQVGHEVNVKAQKVLGWIMRQESS